MPNEKLTFNDLPEVVGKLCERIESLENALKDNFAKQVPVKRKPACPYDRRGSMQLPWNIQVILLLQGQTRRDTCHQAGEASVRISRRTGQMAGDRKKSQVPLSFEEEHEQMLAATRHKAKPREL